MENLYGPSDYGTIEKLANDAQIEQWTMAAEQMELLINKNNLFLRKIRREQ